MRVDRVCWDCILIGRVFWYSYLGAIEGMKATGDYQWQAATIEAYYCALILVLLPKTGVWVCFMTFIRIA